MIDEKLSLKKTISYLIAQPDGKVCIAMTVVSIALAIANLVWPSTISSQSGEAEKWLAIWVLMPLILFMILARMRQLMEGESPASQGFRSVVLVVPVAVLLYFNFFKG